MAICAVNYPTISSEDYEWIQSIRRDHDQLFFKVVDPHFSMVFPTDRIEQTALSKHVRQVLTNVKPFDAVIRCATVSDPDFMDHAHASLIPDEGFSEIVRLHDQLYTGPLVSELRLDMPFVPHIGIASTPDVDECKAIVDRINGERFEIRARVERLDIVGYDGEKTWTIEVCELGAGGVA